MLYEKESPVTNGENGVAAQPAQGQSDLMLETATNYTRTTHSHNIRPGRSAVRDKIAAHAARIQRRRAATQTTPEADETPSLDSDATVADLVAFCVEHNLTGLAGFTKDSYERYAAELTVRLGEIRVRDLDSPEVKAMHVKIGEKEGHKTTANRLLTFLRRCCRDAETLRCPDDGKPLREPNTNPCKGVRAYPEEEKTHHIPMGGRLRFIEECNQALCAGYLTRSAWGILLTAYFTGIRRFDVFNLRWQEVRLDVPKPHLRIMARGPKKRASKGGNHIIGLGPAAVELLAKMPRINEFVFPNPRTGKPYTSIRKQANAVYAAAGVPFTGLHGLRHTAATELMEAGLPVLKIRAQMGWSTLACIDRYTHGGEETGVEAALAREQRLFEGRNDDGLQGVSAPTPAAAPVPVSQSVYRRRPHRFPKNPQERRSQ